MNTIKTTEKEKKSLEWAIGIFRPLMKDLHIQNLKQGDQGNIVTTSRYRIMRQKHMDNCVVVVKRFTFSKPNYKGIFLWQYNAKNKIYVLWILLNNDMYNDTSENAGVCRKAVSTHEYTHCVAALMTTAELATEELIKRQQEKLKKSFHAFEESNIKKQLDDLKQQQDKISEEKSFFFGDEHFRTGDEDFQASYVDLYQNLLLSYVLFREQFFTDAVMQRFYHQLKQKSSEAVNILNTVIEDISNQKNLDKEFVHRRIFDDFLPQTFNEMNERNLM